MDGVLQNLVTGFAGAVAGLDAAQTQLRPRNLPEKWSIQQIAGHLFLTYDLSSVAIEKRLSRGSPAKAVPTLRQRLSQWVVLRMGFLPSGQAAPEAVKPPPDPAPADGAALAASAKEKIARLNALAEQAESLFGEARCVNHMILGPLSIPQWRRFQLVHGRHHLKQIRNIRRQHGV